MQFVLEDDENDAARALDARVPLRSVGSDAREEDAKKCVNEQPTRPPGGLSTLQRSSFAFLPAAVATLVRALTGTRLLLSHAWTCGVFALSVANHSRDYRDGPCWDALDTVDKVFAWALGISGFADGLAHLPPWRFWTASSLGLATLALFCASRFLKSAVANDPAPAAALRKHRALVAPELLHVCMHLAAGAAALLVVA